MVGGKAQTLQDYLDIAKKNSPELQAKQFQYESALEKVTEIGSIPNTKFLVGYFVQEPETRVGAQTVKLSAFQNLPGFGSYSALSVEFSLKIFHAWANTANTRTGGIGLASPPAPSFQHNVRSRRLSGRAR